MGNLIVGHWCYWKLHCIPPDPATRSVAQQQFPCLTLGTWVLTLITLSHTAGDREATTHQGKFQDVLDPTEGRDGWRTGGLQDTSAPPWPREDSILRGQGCTQTPSSAQTIAGTLDPVGPLCVSGRTQPHV